MSGRADNVGPDKGGEGKGAGGKDGGTGMMTFAVLVAGAGDGGVKGFGATFAIGSVSLGKRTSSNASDNAAVAGIQIQLRHVHGPRRADG
jgi:hypothetical protein